MDQAFPLSTLIQPTQTAAPWSGGLGLDAAQTENARRGSHRLRVRVVGCDAASLAPGGGEVQLAETSSALRELDVDACPWRDGHDRLENVDVLHIFGSLKERLALAQQARRRGVAVVVSTIAWFDVASRWHEPGTVSSRLLRFGKYALASAAPWAPTWRKRLYQTAQLLLPNSDAERRQLMRRFRMADESVQVVPNGASLRFGDADAQAFADKVSGTGYVLIPGRIEPRKNQLNVLRALHGHGHRVVVLGDAVPGYEDYANKCRQTADNQTTFHPRISHDDPLLASAYAGCGCVSLVSWFETPGLVALEAAMTGVPLALTSRGCTQEYFGRFAAYANPADATSIRAAVKAALERGRDPELSNHVRSKFTWRKVAEATLAAYERALWMNAEGKRRPASARSTM